MLPPVLERVEDRLLCRAVQEACFLLAKDRPSAGYRCLQAGLERACELAGAGAPWAEGLVESYRAALYHYSCLYPVRPRRE
jgi:hypothetical protein